MNDFCRTFELGELMPYYCWRDSCTCLEACGQPATKSRPEKPAEYIAHNSQHDADFEAWILQHLLNGQTLPYENPRQPRVYSDRPTP